MGHNNLGLVVRRGNGAFVQTPCNRIVVTVLSFIF
jgi:hypothetical protein